MRLQPDQKKHHHNQLILNTIYSHNDSFILPITHESASHGRGPLLTQMPGNITEKFAGLKAYLGYLFTHPGKKTLFMGSEIASFNEWGIHQALEWGLLAKSGMHKDFQTLVKDMNHLYVNEAPLYEMDQDKEGFRWIMTNDHAHSLFAFIRYDRDNNPVLTICNMTTVSYDDYCLDVPQKGQWRELVNTGAVKYGGTNESDRLITTENLGSHSRKHPMIVTIPALSTLVFKLENP